MEFSLATAEALQVLLEAPLKSDIFKRYGLVNGVWDKSIKEMTLSHPTKGHTRCMALNLSGGGFDVSITTSYKPFTAIPPSAAMQYVSHSFRILNVNTVSLQFAQGNGFRSTVTVRHEKVGAAYSYTSFLLNVQPPKKPLWLRNRLLCNFNIGINMENFSSQVHAHSWYNIIAKDSETLTTLIEAASDLITSESSLDRVAFTQSPLNGCSLASTQQTPLVYWTALDDCIDHSGDLVATLSETNLDFSLQLGLADSPLNQFIHYRNGVLTMVSLLDGKMVLSPEAIISSIKDGVEIDMAHFENLAKFPAWTK